ISIHLTYRAQTEFFTGDASQFKRMLINLIRNSIQADADMVNFSIDENEKYLLVSVSDNGKGIPDKFLNKIFNLNFTTKSTGMGIGLKLAKKFVESIDGDIAVKETSESGTTFLINLPKDI
ncbi:MAG: HAMP domain-containing sensor histidine kinase, partial [Ignavibacteria bacterium]|nr:HAMP domain-containing sensor histidine kinase [Ignavibacteria bacterium]